jgi:hypothetical protein
MVQFENSSGWLIFLCLGTVLILQQGVPYCYGQNHSTGTRYHRYSESLSSKAVSDQIRSVIVYKKQRWAKGRLSTFDLYLGGGGTWGAGTNMSHPDPS